MMRLDGLLLIEWNKDRNKRFKFRGIKGLWEFLNEFLEILGVKNQ